MTPNFSELMNPDNDEKEQIMREMMETVQDEDLFFGPEVTQGIGA
jgi:hypothetical protein